MTLRPVIVVKQSTLEQILKQLPGRNSENQ